MKTVVSPLEILNKLRNKKGIPKKKYVLSSRPQPEKIQEWVKLIHEMPEIREEKIEICRNDDCKQSRMHLALAHKMLDTEQF